MQTVTERMFTNRRLAAEATTLETQLTQLKAGVQRELDGGGFRLAPVKSRLQEMLTDFSLYRNSAVENSRQLLQPHVMQQLPSVPPDQSGGFSESQVRLHCLQAA